MTGVRKLIGIDFTLKSGRHVRSVCSEFAVRTIISNWHTGYYHRQNARTISNVEESPPIQDVWCVLIDQIACITTYDPTKENVS